MQQVHNFPTSDALARASAEHAVATLQQAIAQHGTATWVLAGGSTPNRAYTYIVEHLLDSVDWSHVTILLGDERCGPLDGPDNNWHGIHAIFLRFIPQATLHRPQTQQPAEAAAEQYAHTIQPIDRYDLVWLGMGEDGHTLSLFPEHADFVPADSRLVVPIHNSPKPPSDRVSFTLHALSKAVVTVVLASGEGKSETLAHALRPGSQLPVALAARATNALWYIDAAAAKNLT